MRLFVKYNMVRYMRNFRVRKALLEFLVDATNWHLAELRITIYELRIFKFGGYRRRGSKVSPSLPPAPLRARLILSPHSWASVFAYAEAGISRLTKGSRMLMPQRRTPLRALRRTRVARRVLLSTVPLKKASQAIHTCEAWWEMVYFFT